MLSDCVVGVTMELSKAEWELALNEDYSSFEVNKMTVQTPTALHQRGY